MTTTLRVRVSRTALVAADGTASARTVLAVRPDSPVDVQVIPSRNVALDGPDLDRLLLPPGGGWSELQFAVHAVAAGPVRLKVLARQGRELLGSVTLEADAVDPDAVIGGAQALTRAQVEVASASSPVLADVAWLEIAQVEADDETRFRYELRLPGNSDRITGTSPPIRDADAFVSSLFREVQQLWFDNSDKPAKYLADLQDLGSSLFEQLFPQDLQAVLWKNRDNLDNLFLIADEPFIPWELVHLKPPVGPRQKAPRFLGQLGLVRWQFTPFPPQPQLQARAGKVFSVCPEYEDPSLDLAEVQAEAQFLTTTFGATAVHATEQKVRQLLRRRGGFDLLHFSGHGLADQGNIGEAKIVLAGRTVGGALVSDYLTSTTVAENAKFGNRSGAGPLVVLNACQVGRSGEELSSLGGFARAFLEAGASAFVSCLWSVNQTPARIFVETFYRAAAGRRRRSPMPPSRPARPPGPPATPPGSPTSSTPVRTPCSSAADPAYPHTSVNPPTLAVPTTTKGPNPMAAQALCVGINEFAHLPNANWLNGCVNDANDMAAMLRTQPGFSRRNITVLTDADATKANVLSKLTDIIGKAKAGKLDHVVFSFSSHGTQVPDQNGDETVDHVDEAFACYDIAQKGGDWDRDTVIIDDELHALLSDIPKGVLVEVFLDTCHSGTGLKDLLPGQKARFLPPPTRRGMQRLAAKSDPKGYQELVKTTPAATRAVLFAGCKADQTSADAYFDGRYSGAFTYYFLKALAQDGASSRTALLTATSQSLRSGDFTQRAQLEAVAQGQEGRVRVAGVGDGDG